MPALLRYSSVLLSLLAVTLSVNLAAAAPASKWDPRWQCGKEINIKKHHIRDMQRKKLIFGYKLNNGTLPLLLTQDYNGLGMVLYVQLKNRWRAYPIARDDIPMRIYSTAAHFRISLFSMSGINAKDQHFTVLNIKNQLRHFECLTIPTPKGMNNKNMEYLTLQDFNVRSNGAGQMLAAAYDLRNAGSGQLKWYRYNTSNWGYTWKAPGPIAKPKKGTRLPGLFYPAKEIAPPKNLITSLLKQAR